MCALNKVKSSTTPLNRMPSINPASTELQQTCNIRKEDSAATSSVADDDPVSFFTSGEADQSNKIDILKSYQNLMEKAFFQGNEMPDFKTEEAILDAEDLIFHEVLKAYNKKHSLNIVYTEDLFNLSDLAIHEKWSGRRQFIYDNDCHSIYVDLYKAFDGNISIITINSLNSADGDASEYCIAEHFDDRDFAEGTVTISSFKTDVQKSTLGCKYFSMHFAKAAAYDNAIVQMHEKNIAETAQKRNDTINQAPDERPETLHHPHTIYDVEQSPAILNARYYKHSHSSQRLKALPENRKTENIFKGKNIIERANEYRVAKTDQIFEQDEETLELKPTGIKNINFSNSIDHYRRKRIYEAVESAK